MSDDLTTVEKFDYWQRRMKAEALEEAADALAGMQGAELHIGDPVCEPSASEVYARFEVAVEDPEQWLRDRSVDVMDGSIS